MKRKLSAVAALCLLTLLLILPAQATEQPADGWTKQNGQYYYYENGCLVTDRWVKEGSKWCYVDEDGHLVRSTWLKDQGKWCYVDDAGYMVTRKWVKDGGIWYYLDQYGRMLTDGWAKDAVDWCYVDPYGRLVTDRWVKEGTKWCYVDEDGHLVRSTWLKDKGKWCYVDKAGYLVTGDWAKDSVGWCYLDKYGYVVYDKWVQYEGDWYYLDEDGYMVTGWQEVDGYERYFRPNGAAAKGNLYVSGKTRHFSSGGIPIVLVNPWNKVPSDYTVTLTTVSGATVSEECAPALKQMLAACRKAGYPAYVTSSYRSHSVQTTLFNRKVNYYQSLGYGYSAAKQKAAMEVAVPGTSEHQLGLAVDIVDVNYGALDEKQATMPAQKWLIKNSWRYGFILRYPEGTTDSTGIIYEPWHYRYVGKEVAKEIHDSGLCLEDYLDMLTTGSAPA